MNMNMNMNMNNKYNKVNNSKNSNSNNNGRRSNGKSGSNHKINSNTVNPSFFLSEQSTSPSTSPPTFPEQTSPVSIMPEANPARRLYIFLDNSNIWIEGQRAYSKCKTNSDEPDSRFRVEVGKLLELIVGDRQFHEGLLVG
jgi:hypothetical protein